MATHSSSCLENSMVDYSPWGHRVGHDWATNTFTSDTSVQLSSCESLSRVQLYVTPWTGLPVYHQLLEFTQTHVHGVGDAIQPSHPLLSPSSPTFNLPQRASWSFPMSQFFASGGQSIGASVSTSVLPVNTQDWSPLGWTGWISLQPKGLSRVFSNTAVQTNQFFGTQLSL